MKTGWRKFTISLAALASFTAIKILVPETSATDLGLGIGFLVAPNAVAAIFEYKFKGEQ